MRTYPRLCIALLGGYADGVDAGDVDNEVVYVVDVVEDVHIVGIVVRIPLSM